MLGVPSVTVTASEGCSLRSGGGGTEPCHGLLLTLHLCPQCEASLDGEAGLCWCVYPWSGKRIPESAKVRGDPNCPQYFH